MQYSSQQTQQILNDPPQMGAKSTTTSNHPITPGAPGMVELNLERENQPRWISNDKKRLVETGPKYAGDSFL